MNIHAAYDLPLFDRRARSLKGKLNFKFTTYMMILFILIVVTIETLSV